MASTSPVGGRRPAPPPAPRATGPATSGGRERGAGLGGAADGSASRSASPSTTTSAGIAPRARAFATTSGPIPRGSPRVTARRGREATALEADVHVSRASQQVEIVLLGEPLAQRVADPILHVLESELALRQALEELEHDEPRPPGPLPDRDDGLEARHGVVPDRLEVVGGELRNGERIGELRLVGVVIAAGGRGRRRRPPPGRRCRSRSAAPRLRSRRRPAARRPATPRADARELSPPSRASAR